MIQLLCFLPASNLFLSRMLLHRDKKYLIYNIIVTALFTYNMQLKQLIIVLWIGCCTCVLFYRSNQIINDDSQDIAKSS